MGAFTPPRPLAADDDTAAFDCGRDALNHWFHRHAWRKAFYPGARLVDPSTIGFDTDQCFELLRLLQFVTGD